MGYIFSLNSSHSITFLLFSSQDQYPLSALGRNLLVGLGDNKERTFMDRGLGQRMGPTTQAPKEEDMIFDTQVWVWESSRSYDARCLGLGCVRAWVIWCLTLRIRVRGKLGMLMGEGLIWRRSILGMSDGNEGDW